MDRPEKMKGLDSRNERSRDSEELNGEDKRRQRSSKSRKAGNGEEGDGSDGSGRRRSSTGDRSESRKRTVGSSRADYNDDDYEARKESRSKQMMKKQEESSTLEKLSSWYEDGEQHENKREGERRKSTSKFSDKAKDDDRSHDRDRGVVYLEKKETDQDKDHGPSELRRSRKKRWDDTDVMMNVEEGNCVEKLDQSRGKFADIKLESAGEISVLGGEDNKSRGLDSLEERGMKSYDRGVERIDPERSRSRGKSEAPEEDNKGSSPVHEQRSGKGQIEQKSLVNRDDIETRERSFNAPDDGTWARDRNRRESGHSNWSKSPERSVRRHYEIANFDMDQERGVVSKSKEPEKEGHRDDRSKGREHDREWEIVHRHGRDYERHQGRFGGRKDLAVKTSAAYGISDVIEIQTKPFDRRSEPPQQSETKFEPKDEWTNAPDRPRKTDTFGAGFSSDGLSSSRYLDNGPSTRDQNAWKDENDFQDDKMRGQKNSTMPNRNAAAAVQTSQETGSFGRGAQQGAKGSRGGRGGRGRPAGRDNQPPYGMPVPIMGSPFGPIGMPPPGPMQPLNPSMSPAPGGPPMSPNIFIPPFPPPVVWAGARGLEMNLLAVPPGLPPVPPGPSGPRFSSNLGNPPNPALFFNQQGLGMGEPPSISSPGVNAMVPVGRGQNQDKGSGYGFPSRTSGPLGKAPSRGEQNDYSQNFVDTGMRPQNFIRELELTAVVEDYPKLRELIQKKDEIVANSATAPMYYKCDLREHVLSPEFFGTKFDVILVDPPWEEYVHRAPGVTDHMEYWTFEEIMNLKIEVIADTPSFIFLWVGDGVGLEQGRQCLKKWGFRRCEDICWVKTNKTNATPGLRHDSHTLFQRSKEHCLMGIKGTVRRSTDGHIIHANIDTDVIIAEEPPYGSTAKPEDMYRIVEHFALGRRRLELFGEDHNIRSGWLTVGKGLSSSNFNTEGYVKNFADKDGKVWQGGGGRNPPPEAPHLVLTTPDIEALRPKSPMKNQQQMQQQSASISITTVNNSSSRMPAVNQEASSSNFPAPGPWAAMDTFKGGNIGNDDRNFDMYGYGMNNGQSNEDYLEFESRRGMNLL